MKEVILRKEATQDLATGALAYSHEFTRDIPQQEEFPNIEIKSFEEFQQDLE